MIIKSLQFAKRVILVVFGFTVLLLGIVLSVPGIPGPGFLVIFAGLAILAVEFVWARKLLKRFQDQGARLRDVVLRRKKADIPPPPAATDTTPGKH